MNLKLLLAVISTLTISKGVCEEWSIRGYVDRNNVGYDYKVDVSKLKFAEQWQKGKKMPCDLPQLIEKVDAYVLAKYGQIDLLYEEIEFDYRKYRNGEVKRNYWIITFKLYDSKKNIEVLPVVMLMDGFIVEAQIEKEEAPQHPPKNKQKSQK